MKIVHIWSFSGPYFPAFGLNAEKKIARLDIQSVYKTQLSIQFVNRLNRWKVSVFGVFLVRTFVHRTKYCVSVFSANAWKYRPGKLRIRTLFTPYNLFINKLFTELSLIYWFYTKSCNFCCMGTGYWWIKFKSVAFKLFRLILMQNIQFNLQGFDYVHF